MTRKRTVWIPLGIAALVVVGMAARPQASMTVAFVNVPEVLEETPGFEVARSRFEAELERHRNEIEALEQSLESKIEDFERQESAMNANARRRAIEEIRAAEQALQSRARELEREGQEREEQLLGPIQEKVQVAIDGVREDRGLGLVLDVAIDGSGIVSADPRLDVTQIVIQRVRR